MCAQIMLFNAHLHALYFVAFSIIIVGLIIFNLASGNITLSEIWSYIYKCVTRVPYQPSMEQGGWIGLTDEMMEEQENHQKQNQNQNKANNE